jgi:hypothetical protein
MRIAPISLESPVDCLAGLGISRPKGTGDDASQKRSYSSINITASGIKPKRHDVIVENHS